MKTALTFFKNHWKRMATLFVLSMVGTFAAIHVHKDGIEFVNDGCQCELAAGFIVTVPIDPDYFENSLTEE